MLPRLEFWPGWGRYGAAEVLRQTFGAETQHPHNDVERLRHRVHAYICLYNREEINLQMASLISVTMEAHHFDFTAHWSLLRWILLITAWHWMLLWLLGINSICFQTHPKPIQRSREHSRARQQVKAIFSLLCFLLFLTLTSVCSLALVSYDCKWASHCQIIYVK